MTGHAYAAAQRVMGRADILATWSDEKDRLTRAYGTAAWMSAAEQLSAWMGAAGMSVRRDAGGNVIGHLQSTYVDAPTLLLGSHLDTVRDAGKYDGLLGVLVAIACVELLRDAHQVLPYALEVIAFCDEEALRYPFPYLGSRIYTGHFDETELQVADTEGVTLAQAMRAIGGDPEAAARAGRDMRTVLGYCEAHIEQGPVLEARGLPVGIVTSISGQTRGVATFTGVAGHAGTVPMGLRHDALCAAAEFILAVERVARTHQATVATVGQAHLEPGATNVIPGRVVLSFDVRHQEDDARAHACQAIYDDAVRLCAARGVALDWQLVLQQAAVPCASHLTNLLARATEATGHPVSYLPSGAGHDAVSMARVTDVAMLFVRCKGGISHNPAESVEVDDVAVAIAVMDEFLRLVGDETTGRTG